MQTCHDTITVFLDRNAEVGALAKELRQVLGYPASKETAHDFPHLLSLAQLLESSIDQFSLIED